MKNFFILLILLTSWVTTSHAQNLISGGENTNSSLPIVYLSDNVSIHFVSPEPIQYVDISTKKVIGDLPLKNILRIRSIADSAKNRMLSPPQEAIVTITGEKYIAQYRVIFNTNPDHQVQTKIEILPEHTQPLDVSNIRFSQNDLKEFCLRIIAKRAEGKAGKSTAYGITARLNAIYTLDDYIFLDLGYENETNLRYDTDQIRFTIEDRKVNKASTVQSIEVKPEYVLFDNAPFKKRSRNIYVFRKFTFPGNKMLKIEMNEKQISGRVNNLLVKYNELLGADIIPSK